jgi:hypothetical protein
MTFFFCYIWLPKNLPSTSGQLRKICSLSSGCSERTLPSCTGIFCDSDNVRWVTAHRRTSCAAVRTQKPKSTPTESALPPSWRRRSTCDITLKHWTHDRQAFLKRR